jgi:large subunit ribosomal protein L34
VARSVPSNSRPKVGDTAAIRGNGPAGSAPVSERGEELTNGDHVNFRMRCSTMREPTRCQTHEEITAVAKGKRTFQPNNRRRARVHGFRLRMRTRAGRAIVSNRRRKGRRTLTA